MPPPLWGLASRRGSRLVTQQACSLKGHLHYFHFLVYVVPDQPLAFREDSLGISGIDTGNVNHATELSVTFFCQSVKRFPYTELDALADHRRATLKGPEEKGDRIGFKVHPRQTDLRGNSEG